MQISEAPRAYIDKTQKKDTGGAGTHTGHTGTHGHTDRTDEPHNQANPHQRTRQLAPAPHDRATTGSEADSTAAAPEQTAPRGRLRRGRPLRTRPCRLPLPSSKRPGGARTHTGHTGNTDHADEPHNQPRCQPRRLDSSHSFTTHQNFTTIVHVVPSVHSLQNGTLIRPRSQQSAPMIVIASVQSASLDCLAELSDPVRTPCAHVFCGRCIRAALDTGRWEW